MEFRRWLFRSVRQGNPTGGEMAGFRRRVRESERSRLLDIFARIPRPPLVASLELQVAARHVETGRIAIDVVERRLRFDRPATLCNRDHQFRLVVEIPSFGRSEEHTSELQSLMRNPYAVFCLKKKTSIQVTTQI